MTATATIFALLPLGIGLTGNGGFISQPLAIIVIGGLVSSTLLTLIVLPSLYYLVEGSRERRDARGLAPLPVWQVAIAIDTTVLGAALVGAGVVLRRTPDGSTFGLDPATLDGTPFSDFGGVGLVSIVVGAVLLAVTVVIVVVRLVADRRVVRTVAA
jgi:predicted RND superfamily exporter protein